MTPIRDLTERTRMPRLGKIHLGIKKKNAQGVEYPTAVDYFVCPEEVQKVHGEQPKSLEVVFPSNDLELIAPQYYKAYARSRGAIARGDGFTARHLIDVDKLKENGELVLATGDAKNVQWREMECVGQQCGYFQEGTCKAIMNLQFMLPKVPGLGVYQIDTGSVWSIININSALRLLGSVAGRIAGIPVTLVLEPREVSPDGRKKTVWVLNIELPKLTLDELGNQIKALPDGGFVVVPPPDEEMPDLLYPDAEAKKAQEEADKGREPGPDPLDDLGSSPADDLAADQPSVPGEHPKPTSDSPRFKVLSDFQGAVRHELDRDREWVHSIINMTVGEWIEANRPQDRLDWPGWDHLFAFLQTKSDEEKGADNKEVPPINKWVPPTTGELFSKAWQKHRLSKKVVMEALGVEAAKDITDLGAAWALLEEAVYFKKQQEEKARLEQEEAGRV